MKIEGNAKELSRIQTDLYSLDMALSSRSALGLPVPGIVEIYGRTHVGKSTLAYHLASQVNPKGRVILCDFEGIDVDYVRRAFEQEGFDGTLKIIDAMDDKGKLRTHEDMLDDMTKEFYNEETSAGIVDSIGAISPVFEVENKIEEGFGAKRATIVARFIRRIGVPLRGMELPRPLFVTNHAHEVLGGGYGHQSSGGRALEHVKVASLYLYPRSAMHIKTSEEVLAYVIEGQVEKLRYGKKGRKFHFVIIPEYGVRRNLSALIDASELGIVERGAVVKIGEKSLGRISELYQADVEGRDEVFEPIHKALKEHRDGMGKT